MDTLKRWTIWGAAIFGAIVLLLHLFWFDVWVVPHGADGFAASVLPNLMPDDKVVVQRGKAPAYGELGRCASPLSPGAYVIGRAVGVPGDRVEVTDGRIVTNGKPLSAQHACPTVTVAHPVTQNLIEMTCWVAEPHGSASSSFQYLTTSNSTGGTHLAVVEAGKLYLVSDNRVMHEDSRDFGQVEASTCDRIVYRLWGEKFSDSSRRFTLLQ